MRRMAADLRENSTYLRKTASRELQIILQCKHRKCAADGTCACTHFSEGREGVARSGGADAVVRRGWGCNG